MNHITSPHLWLLSVALAMNPCLGLLNSDPREAARAKEHKGNRAPAEIAPAGPRSLRPASPGSKATEPSSRGDQSEHHRATP